MITSISSADLLTILQEAESPREDIIEELASRLISGKCLYTRLLQGDTIGITTKAHWVGLIEGERQFCPSKRMMRSASQIEKELQQWAINNGCWITETELRSISDETEMFSSGTESVVYIDEERKNVYKLMHPREGYEVVSLGDMLDSIALFNRVFQSSAYSVEGYGRNDSGVFCALLKQPLIKGRTINNHIKEIGKEETEVNVYLDAAMIQLGFEKNEMRWIKDQYQVTDITGSNIVSLPSGITIVIDADVTYVDGDYFNDNTFEDVVT